MKTTVVSLYSSISVAYYVLLNLNQAGCETKEMSLVVQQEPLDDEAKAARKKAMLGTGIDFNTALGDITALLENVGTIYVPRKLKIITAGPLHKLFKKTLDVAFRNSVDPMPASLIAALLELNIGEDDAGMLTHGVQEGQVLVIAQVTDSLKDHTISIMNAFLSKNLTSRRDVWQPDYIGVFNPSVNTDAEPILAADSYPNMRGGGELDETKPSGRSFAQQLQRKH